MRAAVAPLLIGAAQLVGACSDPCCTIDSHPIPLARAPGGALLARAVVDGQAGAVSVVVDTGSPVTLFHGILAGKPQVSGRSFRLLDATSADPSSPVRAIFRNISTLTVPLGALGREGESAAPAAILAGDLLRNFSVELDFTRPSATLWPRLAASEAFLASAGYAIVHFELYGGGEIDALGPPDFLGFRGPPSFPATRIVLRACAAPAPFFPGEPRVPCCLGNVPGQATERTLATGSDVSLVLSTGVGPIVLSESAWARIAARLPPQTPTSQQALLVPSFADPIPALWMRLPRLALVDLEAGAALDPGPCVELGRSRRLEQVAWAALNEPATNACPQPCDQDPRARDKAQNSAAYIEVGGALDVAVVADGSQLLQALRFDVRPEGPEVDGILGAAAMASVRLELDYRTPPGRAVFSCEPHACESPSDAARRATCWAAARCPRLPDAAARRACFCLPPHGRPAQTACEASGC